MSEGTSPSSSSDDGSRSTPSNLPKAATRARRKRTSDSRLRLWRLSDPYATRRRTAVDYRFHTKEQQDFYETILLDKKSIVCDMRWVDWKYIKENE